MNTEYSTQLARKTFRYTVRFAESPGIKKDANISEHMIGTKFSVTDFQHTTSIN